MNPYEIALYVIILGGALLDVFVSLLNVRVARTELPKEFVGLYDAEKYAKSQSYLKTNTRFSILETLFSAAVTAVFLASGGFAWVDTFARSFEYGNILTGLIFAATLLAGAKIISLPFSLYSTFVIEERFGFNKMTLGTYFSDLIKGLILGVLLGAPVLAGILWFFETVGSNAWLWCWLALTAFQLLVMFLAPAFIMPLFNKFIPLPDGDLKNAIEAYAKSQNFKLQGIYTMDGSKRSTKANAYFTGFGKYRRVVLFDTLIEKHTTEELVAVLAHEIGHFKKKHITKQLALSIITTGVMFYLLSIFMNNPQLFAAFQVPQPSVYASLVFFGFLYAPISSAISLVSLYLSRKYEFEADAYSAETYGKPLVMKDALKKLSVENLSNLTPHPVAVFLRYTHPPVLARLSKLSEFKTIET